MINYLIVGIGNVGDEYLGTRHNIGFGFLDFMAQHYGTKYDSDKLAYVSNIRIKNKSLYLIKPKTFVNLSGKAVAYWVREKKIDITNNLLVISDDINLNFGKVRFRKKGSCGGHNGLSNINERLQTNNYARIRIGIGNEFKKGKQSEYVLAKFSAQQQGFINDIYDKVIVTLKDVWKI